MEKILTKRFSLANDLLELNYPKNETSNDLTSARERARERFKNLGVPLPKDEYWKFSSPQKFTSLKAENKKMNVPPDLSVDLNTGDIQLYFIDGVLDEKASDLNAADDNLDIISMTNYSRVNETWVRDLYGELEAASHKKIKRSLSAFNTACASGGLFIRVKEGAARRIVINYIGKRLNSNSIIHHLIRLDADTSLTLIEKGEGADRSSRVTEIDLLPNACLNHIRFFGNKVISDFLSQIFVRQATKSTYKEFSLVINNEFIRNEFYISLEGEESKVSLSGANLGAENNLQDNTIFIAHLKRNCKSRQVFKNVLTGKATGVFQGKIYVTSEAQKTDGYQISKGLLIGNESKFLTKPELEIYADDVVCSHGSTCGAIDEDSLFYLTSRGVTRKEAISMLILAFLDEAVQEVESDELSEEIRGILWMESENRSD